MRWYIYVVLNDANIRAGLSSERGCEEVRYWGRNRMGRVGFINGNGIGWK